MDQTNTVLHTSQQVVASSPFFKGLVVSKLQGISRGQLTVIEGRQKTVFGENSARPEITATIRVADARMWRSVVSRGSVGAGEAYMSAWWSTDDLTAVVRILVLNREVLDGMDGKFISLVKPFWKAWHWLRRNNREGSKQNIAAHYDLSNDFFKLFLDETMMYSSAVFSNKEMTLADASRNKNERLCKKLDLKKTDHVVEIGTGWGGFALHAAKEYGCRVTTTTISAEQFNLATQRVREAGLQDLVTVLLKDYRDLTGKYDKLVSIEMIEAVGNSYYEQYFAACSRLLKQDGIAAIQAITIMDQQFESALRNVDFIQKYIFPGSCLPSTARFMEAVKKATDFRLFHLEDITPHYAETLKIWRENFLSQRAEVLSLGLDEEFIRMWEFYLCYSEGGFRERVIGDVQLVFTKPDNRRDAIQ